MWVRHTVNHQDFTQQISTKHQMLTILKPQRSSSEWVWLTEQVHMTHWFSCRDGKRSWLAKVSPGWYTVPLCRQTFTGALRPAGLLCWSYEKGRTYSTVHKYLDSGTISVLLALYSSTLDLNEKKCIRVQTVTFDFRAFTSVLGDPCTNYIPCEKMPKRSHTWPKEAIEYTGIIRNSWEANCPITFGPLK